MSALVYTTKCDLCGWTTQMHGLPDGDVNPRDVPPDVINFNAKLYEHLQKGAAAEQKSLDAAVKYHRKHPDTPPPDLSKTPHLQAFQEIIARTVLAQGSATMHPYSSQDPVFQKMKDIARLRLNTVTRKFYYTDEMLENAVVQLNLDPEPQAMVATLVKAIRDSLMEQGDYAPDKDRARSRLVTV